VAYDQLGADAVTTNPYLGVDSLRPFLERDDRGIFLLARTSNPSAPELQDLESDGVPLYETVARRAAGWHEHFPGVCGLVVGATYPDELKRIRAVAHDLPFLIPGIGSQGGSLAPAVEYGPTVGGTGPVVNSSRGIIYASAGPDFAQAARIATVALRARINGQREEV
jgi:orotidine-5'-phosphate decarboxylase